MIHSSIAMASTYVLYRRSLALDIWPLAALYLGHLGRFFAHMICLMRIGSRQVIRAGHIFALVIGKAAMCWPLDANHRVVWAQSATARAKGADTQGWKCLQC